MVDKSRLNVWWTCRTCALEIPGESSVCPNCSRQPEDSKELSWRVEDSASDTLITVVSRYGVSTRIRRDNATRTLTVGDGIIVPPSSMIWVRGRFFEVSGWLDWKVSLGQIAIAEGGDVRPASLVSDFAHTLARVLGVQLEESVEQEWGTW